MAEDAQTDLVTLTAEIASAYVTNNSVTKDELLQLISEIHAGLSSASSGAAPAPTEVRKPEPAVSARKSLSDPSVILSMIDGKPYKSLKRHLGRHGYTPQSYREAFDLPSSYPMVAPAYREARSQVALRIGLGRKKPSTDDAAHAALLEDSQLPGFEPQAG